MRLRPIKKNSDDLFTEQSFALKSKCGIQFEKKLVINTRYLSIPIYSFYMLKSLFIRKNKEYSQYSFGDFSYGQPNVVAIDSQGKLKVGKFCQFGGGVLIMLNSSGGHRPEWVTTYPFTQFFDDFKNLPFPTAKKLDVTIGNDVWIGANSTILSGVNIGDGAIIGASSVVTKDVPPYSVFAGNPAKLVRLRFAPEIIEKLLEIKWWDWGPQRIKENMPLLLSDNIEEFISKNSNGSIV